MIKGTAANIRRERQRKIRSMTPPLKRIASEDELPHQVDVVVIGGGIIGVAAAWSLASRGTRVAILEKGEVGAEQSSRNWGWCRQQNRDLRELPLAQLSLRMWSTLTQNVGAELGFRRTGLIYATNNPKDLEVWEKWRISAIELGMETSMLTSRQVAELLPGNTRTWLGGVHSPTDGRAEPELVTPAIAEAARLHGATIHQYCAARELETTAGRISGVITERGLVKCSAVLVAGGSWSGMFLRHHGITFHQASVQATSFFTSAGPEVIAGNLSMQDVTIRRRIDGGYTVGLSGVGTIPLAPQGILQVGPFRKMFLERGRSLAFSIGGSFFNGPESLHRWKGDSVSPFESVRILDPAANKKLVASGLARLAAVYPALSGVRPARVWGGMMDSTPDAIPVISSVQSKPGLFIASGFSGHGFGIGPASGRLAADLIRGDTPCVDPKPFRYERMIDESEIEVASMM
jgi:glycine/D-amino acid oxidase-like deaminating enzyme